MKTLTVFTPTYNRAHLLPRLYESLINQTNQNFCWLIIDDGSEDATKKLVQDWIKENRIEIEYHFKTNGGLHTAYNLGIEKASTELFICIDSDDYPPKDGVQKILDFWTLKGNSNYAGIVGLDYTFSNMPIGSRLPEQNDIHFIDIKMNFKSVGDCKFVHRTELLKKHTPMPVFKGEKNFNPSYIFLKVDKEYPVLILNENLCFVDYQVDGMSNNILKQFKNSPNSFMELRLLYLSLPNTKFSFRIRHTIHYMSSCLFAEKYNRLFDVSNPFSALFLLPLAVFLNLYIRAKTL